MPVKPGEGMVGFLVISLLPSFEGGEKTVIFQIIYCISMLNTCK